MFSSGTIKIVLGLTVAILCGFCLAAPVADAQGPSGNFCVMYLPTGAHRCVSTQAELAVARSAVLPVRRSAGTNPLQAAPAAVFHIATVWDNAGYDPKRGVYEFYAGADCTAGKLDVNWQNQNLAAIGWSDRISSFQSFGNCQTRIFSGLTFTGSVFPIIGFLAASSNVGAAMNDRTESIRWS